VNGTHVTQNRVKWWDFLKKVVNFLDTSKAREVFARLSDCQHVKVRVLHGQTDMISPMHVHVLHFSHRRVTT
jgi:hypothetical protein